MPSPRRPRRADHRRDGRPGGPRTRSPRPCAAPPRRTSSSRPGSVAPPRPRTSTSTGACSRTCSTRPPPRSPVEHVALVTGLKHYLGPFEAYAKAQPDTPFSEDQARLPYENFYYVQEDILFAAAERDGFTWSVHRPHTLIGWALGNAMNMGVTLAVYAAICRETGRGFHFPGSREQWEAVTDITDASLLADHLVWASTTPAAAEPRAQHRQRRRLPLAAAVAAAGRRARGRARAVRRRRPRRSSSRWPTPARSGPRSCAVTACATSASTRLASWWHTDADLGRTIETFTDMGHSRRLGFLGVRDSESSFTDLFARLRAERIVP